MTLAVMLFLFKIENLKNKAHCRLEMNKLSHLLETLKEELQNLKKARRGWI